MFDRPSPNQGPRRDGLIPEIVVLHYTAMSSAQAAIDRLCDPSSEVSAHYVIDRFGGTTRLVDEERRAWHAGVGEWRGHSDINSRSIGIELDNDGASPFSAALMDALSSLLSGILERWTIPGENVIGHADMAPGRKFDPGRRFDWARLQRAGLSAVVKVPLTPSLFESRFDEAQCAELLRQIGYTSDGQTSDKLRSFRDRFLPMARGDQNAADRAVMMQYLKTYGSSSLC